MAPPPPWCQVSLASGWFAADANPDPQPETAPMKPLPPLPPAQLTDYDRVTTRAHHDGRRFGPRLARMDLRVYATDRISPDTTALAARWQWPEDAVRGWLAGTLDDDAITELLRATAA